MAPTHSLQFPVFSSIVSNSSIPPPSATPPTTSPSTFSHSSNSFTNFASQNPTKNSAAASKNNVALYTVVALMTLAKTLLFSLFASTTTPTSSSISSSTHTRSNNLERSKFLSWPLKQGGNDEIHFIIKNGPRSPAGGGALPLALFNFSKRDTAVLFGNCQRICEQQTEDGNGGSDSLLP
ncbi:tetratricopeptide repeat protein [Striga asiatica]|uniref:Tetratricopeptide repeat protein n=1 Tax=Striga asiatica TaxID=4170 RepID=A0A5A7PCZ5_STRAF|nr:tetratricopeptide repeat protein [Striga asiatica]